MPIKEIQKELQIINGKGEVQFALMSATVQLNPKIDAIHIKKQKVKINGNFENATNQRISK